MKGIKRPSHSSKRTKRPKTADVSIELTPTPEGFAPKTEDATLAASQTGSLASTAASSSSVPDLLNFNLMEEPLASSTFADELQAICMELNPETSPDLTSTATSVELPASNVAPQYIGVEWGMTESPEFICAAALAELSTSSTAASADTSRNFDMESKHKETTGHISDAARNTNRPAEALDDSLNASRASQEFTPSSSQVSKLDNSPTAADMDLGEQYYSPTDTPENLSTKSSGASTIVTPTDVPASNVDASSSAVPLVFDMDPDATISTVYSVGDSKAPSWQDVILESPCASLGARPSSSPDYNSPGPSGTRPPDWSTGAAHRSLDANPSSSSDVTPSGTPGVTPLGSPGFTPSGSPCFTPSGSPGLTPPGSPDITPSGSPGADSPASQSGGKSPTANSDAQEMEPETEQSINSFVGDSPGSRGRNMSPETSITSVKDENSLQNWPPGLPLQSSSELSAPSTSAPPDSSLDVPMDSPTALQRILTPPLQFRSQLISDQDSVPNSPVTSERISSPPLQLRSPSSSDRGSVPGSSRPAEGVSSPPYFRLSLPPGSEWSSESSSEPGSRSGFQPGWKPDSPPASAHGRGSPSTSSQDSQPGHQPLHHERHNADLSPMAMAQNDDSSRDSVLIMNGDVPSSDSAIGSSNSRPPTPPLRLREASPPDASPVIVYEVDPDSEIVRSYVLNAVPQYVNEVMDIRNPEGDPVPSTSAASTSQGTAGAPGPSNTRQDSSPSSTVSSPLSASPPLPFELNPCEGNSPMSSCDVDDDDQGANVPKADQDNSGVSGEQGNAEVPTLPDPAWADAPVPRPRTSLFPDCQGTCPASNSGAPNTVLSTDPPIEVTLTPHGRVFPPITARLQNAPSPIIVAVTSEYRIVNILLQRMYISPENYTWSVSVARDEDGTIQVCTCKRK